MVFPSALVSPASIPSTLPELTDFGKTIICFPRRPQSHRRPLQASDCKAAYGEFRIRHPNSNYLLTHDPDRRSQYSIYCPYSLAVGDCLFMLNFYAFEEATLNLNMKEAVKLAATLVDACFAVSRYDGGRILMREQSFDIQFLHAFHSLSAGNGSVNGLYTLPAGDRQPVGNLATS